MKLIEALKKIKALKKKHLDLQQKISVNCAHLSFETPTYGPEQREIVRGWLQGCEDVSQEICKLTISIQRTNLVTTAAVQLGDNSVTKTVAEWILRRRELAKFDLMAWQKLTDRGLKEGHGKNSMDQPILVTVTRYFDPKERDAKVLLYTEEPGNIDAALETINAVTDLIES